MNERQGIDYGYGRVSTDRQAQSGLSIEAQQEQIRAYHAYRLAPQGIGFGGIFLDPAVSAKKPLRTRPSGAKLFATVERGDHITFAKLDRAFRSVRDCCETCEILAARGVTLHFLDLNVDTSTAFGRFALHILAAAAELERNRLGERIREAHATMRAQGKPSGHYPRYGFKHLGKGKNRREAPDPEMRALGQRIVHLVDVEKKSYDQIRVLFRSEGMRNRDGLVYSMSSLSRMYHAELKLQAQEKDSLVPPQNGEPSNHSGEGHH